LGAANWECGNLTQALTCRVSATRVIMMSGQPLSAISKAVESNLQLCQKIKQLDWFEYFKLFRKHANHLQQSTPDSLTELTKQVDSMRESTNVIARFHALSVLCRSLWFAEHYPDKALYTDLFENHISQLIIYATSWEIWLYYQLALCTWSKDANLVQKAIYRRKMRFIEKNLKYVADQSPVNYRQFYLLAVAERLSLDNHILAALDAYDHVIQIATENSFPQFAALANERAGEYCLQIGRDKFARLYIQEAAYCYMEWGCKLKLELLAKRYEYLQLNIKRDGTKTTVTNLAVTTTSEQLDLQTVLKATRVLLSEIVLIKLLEKMLGIIIENTAANRAVFIDLTGIEGSVIAEMIVSEQAKEFTEINSPLTAYDDLSEKIIQYTKWTKTTVVIPDATESTLYADDVYIKKTQCKSVLCLPIMRKQRLIGLIYLENRKLANIFTATRIVLLETLASEIAVSYENSKFYEKTERLFKSTERFVPKKFLNLLNKENVEEVKLGDCVRIEISVLFTDIRKFTTILERLTPEQAFDFLNRYWKITAPVIRNNNGFINQYQGDGVLALFPHSPDDAINAGIQMLSVLEEFNENQRTMNDTELKIGVGINTGSGMLGIIGEEERIEAAVVSDTANTASRVETLNKTYGTHFLVSDNVVNALHHPKNYLIRKIDKVILKGKKSSNYLYEIVDWSDQVRNSSIEDYLELFNLAYKHYEQNKFKDSLRLFNECLKFRTADPIATLLANRCDEFIKEGTPKHWDGTYILKHK